MPMGDAPAGGCQTGAWARAGGIFWMAKNLGFQIAVEEAKVRAGCNGSVLMLA